MREGFHGVTIIYWRGATNDTYKTHSKCCHFRLSIHVKDSGACRGPFGFFGSIHGHCAPLVVVVVVADVVIVVIVVVLMGDAPCVASKARTQKGGRKRRKIKNKWMYLYHHSADGFVWAIARQREREKERFGRGASLRGNAREWMTCKMHGTHKRGRLGFAPFLNNAPMVFMFGFPDREANTTPFIYSRLDTITRLVMKIINIIIIHKRVPWRVYVALLLH